MDTNFFDASELRLRIFHQALCIVETEDSEKHLRGHVTRCLAREARKLIDRFLE